MDTFYPQVLAGFIMMMTEEGDLIYLTENVSRYIGITQVHFSTTKNVIMNLDIDAESLMHRCTSRGK